jgi:UDP-N-acetylmuramoyl-L-alanyl-D-glutamate--2,6-diaminopimelate ligase
VARLAEGLRQAGRGVDGPAPCWRASRDDPRVELRIVDPVMAADGVSCFLQSPLGEGLFHSPLVGRFNLINLLQAVGVRAGWRTVAGGAGGLRPHP